MRNALPLDHWCRLLDHGDHGIDIEKKHQQGDMENDADAVMVVMGPTWLLGIQSLLQSKRWNH